VFNALRIGSRLLQRLSRRPAGSTASREWLGYAAFDSYVDKEPSAQNAVDLIPGWNAALPPEAGAQAGSRNLYHDPRILWCLEQFGSVAGRKVLELGPLEGSHTYVLDRQAPSILHAIEANKLAFMRCVIVKNLLNLKHAQFFLGDFMRWLERPENDYDLIIASGVLYHVADPIRMLELIAKRTQAVFLWTYHFSETEMPPGDVSRGPFPGDDKVVTFQGRRVTLHHRSYHGAAREAQFCGGMYDTHYWLERDDILMILGALGFDDIRRTHEAVQPELGPSFSVFARRSTVATVGGRG
jgi:hypothetical protein